jgi:hypothetical protein
VSGTDWLEVESVNDDWLNIEDKHAGEVTAAFRHLVDACMRGTDRVMACDGHYLAYRPHNREFDKETNPRTRERFNDFCAAGYYKHIGTYDEVQIYELLEGSPFRHEKSYLVGQDYWRDIREAARLACERKWSDYHDYLGGMAAALKAGRDHLFAKTMWDETLKQVAIQIMHAHGPSEREVNEGFTGVRRARGISKGGVVATLDTSGLQRVGFK